ncbi:hypothetical protein KF840_18600 [bacterium]|nr:hypothetical protein [bacterium]
MAGNRTRAAGVARWRWILLAAALGAAAPAGASPPAAAPPPAPLRACFLSLNEPDELDVFRSHLDAQRFVFTDLGPAAAHPPLSAATSGAPQPWLRSACRADLTCDLVVVSGEFAGRFFGRRGYSLSLQELEEASCDPRCAGLFHRPREVFLLACNTLASKDADSRTPEEYLAVLLDHGFDRAAAERVVALRYGPLGPSFRESLRRIFAGVPRLYGFASVAPRARYSAPMLERYLRARPDYGAALATPGADGTPNRALLSAFAGTALIQSSGMSAAESAATQHDQICALYDERRSVGERLRVAYGLLLRPDALAFVPTLQVFLARHPPAGYDQAERSVLTEIQALDGARRAVLDLLPQLHASALQLELAHFATLVGWLHPAELHALALRAARQLLAEPLSDETVDILCAITDHDSLRDDIAAEQIPPLAYGDPQGLRLIACLAPRDRRVPAHVVPALAVGGDPMLRVWAAHALVRLEPNDEAVLLAVVPYVRDPTPAVAERIRWLIQSRRPLPPAVARAVAAVDPTLLPPPARGRRGG